MATRGEGPRYSVVSSLARKPKAGEDGRTSGQRAVSWFAVVAAIVMVGLLIYGAGRFLSLIIGFFGGWLAAE